jgi:hypothetical protein
MLRRVSTFRSLSIQGCSPSPRPGAALPGNDLRIIRWGPATARKPNDLVLRGCDYRLAGRVQQNIGQPAAFLRSGDQDGAHASRGVPAGAASDGESNWLHPEAPRLDLAGPDHSTLSRHAEVLEVPKLCPSSRRPMHLLVDSTGLQLCGPGEGLIKKYGTRRRLS